MRACPTCNLTGKVDCTACTNGIQKCILCKGSGINPRDNKECLGCLGKGKYTCIQCFGTLKTRCRTCDGQGLIP